MAFGSTRLLIDCGFTLKQTVLRLNRLGLEPDALSAILVTHEHSDHINGVAVLARRFNLPVYMTRGTQDGIRGDWGGVEVRPLPAGAAFQVGSVQVTSVPVPHDAREPVQYVAQARGCRIGVLTDTGHVPASVLAAYQNCQGLLVESNHDPDMLRSGPYPAYLQRRVGGDRGHLNNEQALSFIEKVAIPAGSRVLVGHISDKNNCPDLLHRLLQPLESRLPLLGLATQTHGSPWVSLS